MIHFIGRFIYIIKSKFTFKDSYRKIIKIRMESLENNLIELSSTVESLKENVDKYNLNYKKISDIDIKFNKLNDDLVNKHSYLMHLISDFDYKSWLAGNGCIISETTKLYESQFIWDCVHYPYWLYLMSSMIEKGDKKSAEEILVKYIEKHHHKDIENYPLVSSLCVDLAITNENIRKSSFVLKSLYNNRSLLKEICSNKRIALVGNGPSEIDTRNGEIIDKFDIVIRFNNFMTDGFEKDYGKKTDIWVRNSAGNDIRNKIDIGEYSAVIWEADYHHFPFHYDDLHTINSQLTLHPDKISNFDSITHQLLSKKYQITQPTTGLITLFYLVTFVRPVKIGLFGFTFKEQEPQYVNNHYFDNRSLDDAAQRLSGHDMVLESKIINAIISESDIIELFL